MYQPDLGRWGVIDPMAELYGAWTPYNYALNNPVRLIDPNGMTVTETDSSYVITGNDIYGFWDIITRPKTHSIEEGDTYYGLANRKYKGAFSVDDLKEWNPGIDFTKLKIGQVINLASDDDIKMDRIVRFVAKEIEGEGIDSNDPLVLQVIWESLGGKINPNDVKFDDSGNIQGWGIIGELTGPVAQKEIGKWLGKKLAATGASTTVTNLAVGGAKFGFGVIFSTLFLLFDANDVGKGSSTAAQRQMRANNIKKVLDSYFDSK